eukprot:TRINITY_DN20307_c0_g1_i1.p1 TRINITY_DN20307_c0_g1~~TRINITY_DN20307_c0_g1_i1.p1  ORF type:complete len:606 (+),score=197.26 TRINITY_DN20307_c0_g1_i1:97-1914(+)
MTADQAAGAVLTVAAAAAMPRIMMMSHKREVAKFRARIERDAPKEQPGGYLGTSDRTLLRYLRARKWDQKAAFDMYCETVKWREARSIDRYRRTAPGPIGPEGMRFAGQYGYRAQGGVEAHPETRLVGADPKEHLFRTFCAAGCFGRDKVGRPVYIERTGAMAPCLDAMIKFLNRDELTYRHVRQQELMMARLEEIEGDLGRPVDGQFVILDMIDLSYMPNSDGQAVFREVARLDGSHYPETLGKQFLVNAPPLFQLVWRVVKGWIDPNTAQKIEILGKKEFKARLLQFISADQLPKEYGGTLEVELEPVRYALEKKRHKGQHVTPVQVIEQHGRHVADVLSRHAEQLVKRFNEYQQQPKRGGAEGGAGSPLSGGGDPQLCLSAESMAEISHAERMEGADEFTGGGHAPDSDYGEDDGCCSCAGCPLAFMWAVWGALCCTAGAAAAYYSPSGHWRAFAICTATGSIWMLSAIFAAIVGCDLRTTSIGLLNAAEQLVLLLIRGGAQTGAELPLPSMGRPACGAPLRRLQGTVSARVGTMRDRLARRSAPPPAAGPRAASAAAAPAFSARSAPTLADTETNIIQSCGSDGVASPLSPLPRARTGGAE